VPPLVNDLGTPTMRSSEIILHLVRYYCAGS
jgi:hypothetical protein